MLKEKLWSQHVALDNQHEMLNNLNVLIDNQHDLIDVLRIQNSNMQSEQQLMKELYGVQLEHLQSQISEIKSNDSKIQFSTKKYSSILIGTN